ncbi:MAG: HEAT repeat domain-containing protein [Polyangiaceae bacterium]|nr:HEAT repeat domain-containing protein [Polyangiaceae bacterium]
MGIFGLFKKKEQASAGSKDLARYRKLVANRLSQDIDRQDALRQLSQMKTPEAAGVLLTRFSWTLNPTITDHEEKEWAVDGIAAAGKEAIIPLREFCKASESLTWPIKALKRIVSDGEVEEELLAILDQFDTDYTRNPEPKVQLLQALNDFPSDDVRLAVEPFLLDINEEVRFCAVPTVLTADSEDSALAFVEALEDEESLRVKNRIALGLRDKEWCVPEEQREKLAEHLPPGFQVDSAGRVQGDSAN